MMALEGMPLLLLELALGQKMRTGCLGVWKARRLSALTFGFRILTEADIQLGIREN